MRNLLKNHKLLFTMAFVSLMVGFTACSSSSKSIPEDIHVAMNMPGRYNGTVEIAQLKRETTEEVNPIPALGEIQLAVDKDKQLKFKNFPIADIIKALVVEEEANEIIESIGDFNLDIEFDTKNYQEDQLSFQISLEEFVIPVKMVEPVDIIVNVETSEKLGTYKTKDTTGTIEFEIKIKTNTPNVSELPYEAVMKFKFEKISR